MDWSTTHGLVPLEVIGRGGCGVVWGCLDGAARVAAKISDDTQRLAHETEALRRLGPPNTPRLVRASPGVIVMEWLVGESLASRLGGARARIEDMLALAARIDALHALGVAHRDLKPENIWFEAGGAVRLLDLGLAAIAGGPQTATIAGTSTGTSLYMAPEQVLGEPSGPPADIYAFGTIVFELLTGRPPFVGRDARIAHVSQRPPHASEIVASAAPFDAVVAACLAKDASARPPSALVVAHELARVTGTRTTIAARRPAASVAQTATTNRMSARGAAARGVSVAEVVLAAVRSRRLDTVAAAARVLGGMVARVHGEHAIVAFPGVVAERGKALADELAAKLDVLVVTRTAQLAIRGGTRVGLSGPALEDTRWIEALGSAVEAKIVTRGDAGADIAGTPEAPFIGHVALVEALAADVRAALRARTPIVVTVCGPPGAGTSRVLAELRARLAGDAAIVDTLGSVSRPTIVMLDDGHRLGVETLDAIERTTRAAGLPLAVVVATHPALYDHRPLWAEHAVVARRVAIEPLDDADTDRLLLALLRPIEFVAAPLLARLRSLVHGLPGHAVEIVRQLRDAGAVKQFADADGWYLAHDELAGPNPFAIELAQRSLASQAPALRRLAQLAAVLGDAITPARIDALRAGGQLDSGVGLARLAGLGILVEEAAGFRVRHELLRDALTSALSPTERMALHRAAADTTTDLVARARHALGAGRFDEAARVLLELAEAARTRRRDVDAERFYTAALQHLDAERGRALLGRGKVRYRLHRLPEAADDLASARVLLEDAPLAMRIDVRLEQATVADWHERWDDSARFAADAERLAAPDDARLQMALGRSAFRQGRLPDAIALLRRAAASDDHETAIVARMLLGTSLACAGEVDAARALLDAVIDACEATGDLLHLCSALNDRMWVWFKSDAIERAVADQRRASEVARQLGHAHLERATTHNLAELLYWRGQYAEAHQFALRSRSLHDRFIRSSPQDALLVARIAAGADDDRAVAAELAWVDAAYPAPAGILALFRDVLRLVLAPAFDRGAWAHAIDRARAATVMHELPETLWFAARAAVRAGDSVAHAWSAEGRAAVPASDQRWQDRFASLWDEEKRTSCCVN